MSRKTLAARLLVDPTVSAVRSTTKQFVLACHLIMVVLLTANRNAYQTPNVPETKPAPIKNVTIPVPGNVGKTQIVQL